MASASELTPDEFLEKLYEDQSFRDQVAAYLGSTFPLNRTQMSRSLAEAGKRMGYDFTASKMEEGFRRLWLVKSMWCAPRIRYRMNRTISRNLRVRKEKVSREG